MILNVGIRVFDTVKVPEIRHPTSDLIIFSPHPLCLEKGVYEIDLQVQIRLPPNYYLEVDGFYEDIRRGNTIVASTYLSNGNLGVLLRVDEKFVVPKHYKLGVCRFIKSEPFLLFPF